LQYLGVYRKIISKCVLKEYDVRPLTGCVWSAVKTVKKSLTLI